MILFAQYHRRTNLGLEEKRWLVHIWHAVI